ncbi:MAG: glycosyltransferase [Armatimonadetes bacterium]|nr:glycosyltransferase [Armatimonadota bacterium]
MKILLAGRPEGGLIRGGAEIQLETTRDLLRASGHEATVLSPEVREWGDAVHFFGLSDSFWSLASLCLERGVPYVVSSIWYEPGSPTQLKTLRLRRRLEGRYPKKCAKLLRGAARILIPSPEVAGRLSVFFDAEPGKCTVVPSGAIDPTFFAADPDFARSHFGIEGRYVLCVGNFLERKNQLRIVQALKGSGVAVVFAGGDSDRPYFDRCVQESKGGEFRFLGKVPHDGGLLASLVKGCSAFAMPSLLEDFLIAGVEAGSLGKPMVLSTGWNAHEVYGNHALLADPRNLHEIRSMTLKALDMGDSDERAQWFRERYSQDAFLAKTLDAYGDALK